MVEHLRWFRETGFILNDLGIGLGAVAAGEAGVGADLGQCLAPGMRTRWATTVARAAQLS